MALAAEVGATNGRQVLASLNPLRCSGTALPPQLLLIAKMIVLGLLLKGYIPKIPGIYIPMWPILDVIPRPELVRFAMQATIGIGGVLLLCNRAVRICAFAIGATFFFAILASRGFYSNARVFTASILMLIGLYSGPRSIWLIRWQMVLLYFGTGLNKIAQADWRSGWYFEYWMGSMVAPQWYVDLAAALPPMTLSWLFSWITIVMEFAIAICLAVPRLYLIGIWMVLLFHFSAVAATGMSFGIFVITTTFSLLAFVEWPGVGELAIASKPRRGVLRVVVELASKLDFDRVLAVPEPSVPGEAITLVVRWKNRTYSGLRAAQRIALTLPASYFTADLAFIAPSLYLRWIGS